jgi:hypothetical protein
MKQRSKDFTESEVHVASTCVCNNLLRELEKENSSFRKEVQELNNVIARLKTEKKIMKAELKFRARQNVPLVVLWCCCIVCVVCAFYVSKH